MDRHCDRAAAAEQPAMAVSVDPIGTDDRAALTRIAEIEAAGAEAVGAGDLTLDIEGWARNIAPTPYRERVLLGIAEAGLLTGYARVEFGIRENTDLAEAELIVHPDHRRRGFGSRLLGTAETLVRERGRHRLLVYAPQFEAAADDPDALIPPTGAGRVPARDAASSLARKLGYRLEQSERHSVLTLSPGPTVDTQSIDPGTPDPETLDPGTLDPGTGGYRLRTWTGPTPEDLLDPLAVLRGQMSVDVPVGELGFEREVWDAERIRESDLRMQGSGTGIGTVALHAGTGEAAAYTLMEIPHFRTTVAYQGDTFALAEHRGHGLGLAVKQRNLHRARQVQPGLQRVHTWNAEENRWMLAINTALGFRALLLETCWVRQL